MIDEIDSVICDVNVGKNVQRWFNLHFNLFLNVDSTSSTRWRFERLTNVILPASYIGQFSRSYLMASLNDPA